MTTPTVPPETTEPPPETTEPPPPIYDPIDVTTPFVRGEAIFLGTTPTGECVSGSTQWTYEPCGEGLTWVVTTNPLTGDPASIHLPVTGNGSLVLALVAVPLVIFGLVARWWAYNAGNDS
jgi:hypothetical protein